MKRVMPLRKSGVKVSPHVVGRVRARKPVTGDSGGPPINPFALPEFPKSAIPKDRGMAMDSNSGLQANVAYAAASYNQALWNGIGFLGYTYLSELAQRPEYRVISEVIATEMTRKWIKLSAVGDEDKTEQIKQLNAELERLNVREVFADICALDGFFGRSHLYLDTGDTDNPDELKIPIGDGYNSISKAKIGRRRKLQRLKTIEPVWTYPTEYNSNDPLAPNWYNPQSWFVQGKQIHCSRLLTFVGRPVPDMLKPSYSFGGLAMSQMAMPYVNNWLNTRNSVQRLIQSFSVSGVKTNLGAVLTPQGDDLMARVDLFNLMRDNMGLMVLDKDTEEFFNITTPLTSMDLLQAQAQEHMAAISRIPIVKLLGIQPAGLNASSEGEIRTFYDWINAFQRFLFTHNLKRVIGFAMLSLWGNVDEGITFDYEPLWSLDELQEATVKKTKAETGGILITSGAIGADEERKRVASDPDTDYHGLDPDDMPEPPVEEGMEEDGDEDGSDDDAESDDTGTESKSTIENKHSTGHQAEKLKPGKVKTPKVG